MISIIGITWVYNRLDMSLIKELLITVKYYLLLPAIVFYMLSKILSAFRLQQIFTQTGIMISQTDNIKLYWLGMFYNLFLPGGIGGDAYKVIILQKKSSQHWKNIAGLILYDRITGLLALTIFVGIGFLILSNLYWLGLSIIIISLIGWVGFTFIKFMALQKIMFSGFIMSVGVQCLQLISAYLLFTAIAIDTKQVYYILIFLISSVVSVLPLTWGGVGAREVTFVFGTEYFQLDVTAGAVFSMLFFVITLLSSIPGAFINERKLLQK
jgi:uncharacterized membrane protein YbhN (UPF0104 family)